jgi:hypothetical protein
MAVFSVGQREFTSLSQFHGFLAQEETEFDGDLYIMVGLTQYSKAELFSILESRGYSVIAEHGVVTKFEYPHEDGDVQFYLHYGEGNGIILLYSDMHRGDDLKPTVERFLEEHQGVYYLYVSPRLFREIRDDILDRHDVVQITRFVADRTEDSDYPCQIRPDYWRTIQYHGQDGLKTLQEMERNYGVRPKNLTFNIPNESSFRVIRRGVFAVQSGALEIPFRYIQMCIEETEAVRRAHKKSGFDMMPASSTVSVPSSQPATVDLPGNLKYHEVGDLVDVMGQNDYIVVDSFAQEGSLYFSSKVIDKKKNDVFKVKATEDEIRIFPLEEEKDLGSLYRFFEFIQDNIDQNAKVRVTG